MFRDPFRCIGGSWGVFVQVGRVTEKGTAGRRILLFAGKCDQAEPKGGGWYSISGREREEQSSLLRVDLCGHPPLGEA